MSAIPEKTETKKKLILNVLDEMKADDIVEVPLEGKSTIGDYIVIASGSSNRHVNAIADRLYEALKEGGYGSARIEGVPACDWVLMDSDDILIHIFRPEVRAFYNLEKIWNIDRLPEITIPV